MRTERPVPGLLCGTGKFTEGFEQVLASDREQTAPISTWLHSVCSHYPSEPSTQPGECSATPLQAQGPGETHVRWARNAQRWPAAHILSSLTVSSAPFLLAQSHKKESAASVPALQRPGEIGRAQECLKAGAI